ncbi:hypothetical protein CHS0354_029380 [Potamilus streckersoni]|uniref:WH1 domain-containing protein n=1 Tax=Potamilus streckersoni TaxID=2493646 RepID=A0AAE0SUB3_9BIVA|nr:hypothetical protein CHS0354_029380 [Potamilus streckersoni]
MTENSNKDEEYLVRVPAQVMTRDDSSGGWVPMGGGGLSYVGLKRRSKEDNLSKNEYLIYGERIADNSVVLNCDLTKDIRYTKANPKFHHWHIDDKRFGLTFERYDDAKAFDRGIKSAVADLTDGGIFKPDVEEEVFEILNLPMSRKGSSSQSTASTTTSSPQSPSSFVSAMTEPFYNSHNSHLHHLHRVHYVTSPLRAGHKHTSPNSSDKSSKSDNSIDCSYGQDVWVKADEPTSLSSKSEQVLLDNSDNVELKEYSYVFFARNKPHEYSYPNLESIQKPPAKREATSNIKKQLQSHITDQPKPPLPIKKKKNRRKTSIQQQSGRLLTRARCKHCHAMFSHEENHRGSCEEAPDSVEKCIEIVTCVWCPKGLIYHCMSDADGEYGHPCTCDPSDNSNCKKWTALSILSFIVPCLWCYWPLKACHKCGVALGCCGGRHKAA